MKKQTNKFAFCNLHFARKTKQQLAFWLIIAGCLFPAINSFSQDSTKSSSSGDLKCVFTGDVFFGFKSVGSPTNTATFNTLGYNPVILYKLSDRLFFEGELEFQTSRWQEDATATSGNAAAEGLAVEMEFANMNFVINKYMLLKAGVMFTPYGVFEDWYHQRITNRMVSRPVGIGHGGIEPGADEGIQLNGGIPIGTGKLHYTVAVLNGAKLITQQDDAASTKTQNIGNLEYENIIDNNTNKAVVGRLGVLPFSSNWLEFGAWYGSQIVSADNDKLNSGIQAVHSGAYLSVVAPIDQIKGTLTFRSQLSQLAIGDFKFTKTSDTGANIGKTYTFANNNSSAYYAQLCYRPNMLTSKFLKRLELAIRYGSVTYPDQALGGWIMPSTTSGVKNKTQMAYALDYWLKWNAVLKISWEQLNYPAVGAQKAPAVQPTGSFNIQAAFGL